MCTYPKSNACSWEMPCLRYKEKVGNKGRLELNAPIVVCRVGSLFVRQKEKHSERRPAKASQLASFVDRARTAQPHVRSPSLSLC